MPSSPSASREAGSFLGPLRLRPQRAQVGRSSINETNLQADAPIGFIKEGRRLNYFSMVTTVGAPQTVAARKPRIECMFPADAETEALHAVLVSEGAA